MHLGVIAPDWCDHFSKMFFWLASGILLQPGVVPLRLYAQTGNGLGSVMGENVQVTLHLSLHRLMVGITLCFYLQSDLAVTDPVIAGTLLYRTLSNPNGAHQRSYYAEYNGPDKFFKIYHPCYHINNTCYTGRASR